MTAERFREFFGAPPTVEADAPGRVNLIGEHTDYNGGFVMPSAIPQRTTVWLAPRPDDTVHAVSVEVGSATYRIGHEARTGNWIDYVQGMTRALAGAGRLSGFNALVASNVPLGSGLSSSAALEVAFGRALRAAFSLPVSDVEIARAGQRAEHDLVGAPVGIMDQMAASLADTRTALFLDTRTLEYRRIPLPDAAALIAIHSGIVHRNAAGEYAVRRAECHQAAALLGVRELRDASLDDLPRINALPPPLDRRARHVVTENARVLDAVTAIERTDLVRLGALLIAAHASLRDDFNVSVPAIDTLVEIACADQRVYGARLTGGGFGGSVVIVAQRGHERESASTIAREYERRTGHEPQVVMPISTE
jgi:galactokinase